MSQLALFSQAPVKARRVPLVQYVAILDYTADGERRRTAGRGLLPLCALHDCRDQLDDLHGDGWEPDRFVVLAGGNRLCWDWRRGPEQHQQVPECLRTTR